MAVLQRPSKLKAIACDLILAFKVFKIFKDHTFHVTMQFNGDDLGIE